MNILKNNIITLFLVLPVCYPCAAFAIDFFTDKNVIWQGSLNEYFKYADQDTSSLGRNDHPVVLDAKEISAITGLLRIRENDSQAATTAYEPVFTVQQTAMLGEHLAKGLSSAKSDQDIIFAMEKSVDRFVGMTPNRYFVAGRVFYKDNKLNIIIGEYDLPRDDGYEAAYDPTHTGIVRYHFDQGKRLKNSGFDKTIVGVEGVGNKQLNDAQRSDWLVIDVNAASKAYSQMITARKQEELAEKRKELEEVLGAEEAGPREAEQEALRQRLERLEQEVQSQQPGTGPASAGKPATTTVAPAAQAPAETSLEAQLRVLKRLLEQGLITEEIYTRRVDALLDENF